MSAGLGRAHFLLAPSGNEALPSSRTLIIFTVFVLASAWTAAAVGQSRLSPFLRAALVRPRLTAKRATAGLRGKLISLLQRSQLFLVTQRWPLEMAVIITNPDGVWHCLLL